MAKVFPANIPPDAYPRVRGKFLVQPGIGGLHAQKWPRKRGKPTHPAVIFTSTQFGRAGQMAANSEPVQFETARQLTKGTDWLPRDLLTLAAYGKAYELFAPDGTKFTQADHGYPGPVQEGIPTVRQWYFNAAQQVWSSTSSTSTAAFKGSTFTPTQAFDLHGVSAMLTPVSGGTYRAVSCALDASNVIQSVAYGTPVTFSTFTKRICSFPLEDAFVANQRYAVMIGRTDAASTYALPVVAPPQPNWLFPCIDLGYAALQSVAPAVGETVSQNTGANHYLAMLLEG